MTSVVNPIRRPVFIGRPPLQSGEYVIGLELIENCLHEARLLHQAHWEETEVLYLDDMPMDPDYDQYVALEARGLFHYYTVRQQETKQLVGNLMVYLRRSLHSKGMHVAHEDAFFLLRDHRGGRLASDLLAYAEQVLMSIGITHMGMSDKAPCGGPDLTRFLTKRGFKPVATWYLKSLGASDEASTDQD